MRRTKIQVKLRGDQSRGKEPSDSACLRICADCLCRCERAFTL